MSAKAGKLAAGFSAVQDAIEKSRVELLLYATDLSDGTREKLDHKALESLRTATLLTRDEMGRLLSRELVGVVAFIDKGLADAVWNEWNRLKSLINEHE
jgi:ribosomal protein L7Ae-like RNA K-turn-binding protein